MCSRSEPRQRPQLGPNEAHACCLHFQAHPARRCADAHMAARGWLAREASGPPAPPQPMSCPFEPRSNLRQNAPPAAALCLPRRQIAQSCVCVDGHRVVRSRRSVSDNRIIIIAFRTTCACATTMMSRPLASVVNVGAPAVVSSAAAPPAAQRHATTSSSSGGSGGSRRRVMGYGGKMEVGGARCTRGVRPRLPPQIAPICPWAYRF